MLNIQMSKDKLGFSVDDLWGQILKNDMPYALYGVTVAGISRMFDQKLRILLDF